MSTLFCNAKNVSSSTFVMIPVVKTAERLHVLDKRASRAQPHSSRDAQRLRELIFKAVQEERQRKKESTTIAPSLKRVPNEPPAGFEKLRQRFHHPHGDEDEAASDGIEELRCVDVIMT